MAKAGTTPPTHLLLYTCSSVFSVNINLISSCLGQKLWISLDSIPIHQRIPVASLSLHLLQPLTCALLSSLTWATATAPNSNPASTLALRVSSPHSQLSTQQFVKQVRPSEHLAQSLGGSSRIPSKEMHQVPATPYEAWPQIPPSPLRFHLPHPGPFQLH